MTPADKAALYALVNELTIRASSRERPGDPVSLEAVQVQALADCARALEGLHDVVPALGTVKPLRIRDALAFDGDFSAAGFVELRPSEQ